jgi:hypothetical protein
MALPRRSAPAYECSRSGRSPLFGAYGRLALRMFQNRIMSTAEGGEKG